MRKTKRFDGPLKSGTVWQQNAGNTREYNRRPFLVDALRVELHIPQYQVNAFERVEHGVLGI